MTQELSSSLKHREIPAAVARVIRKGNWMIRADLGGWSNREIFLWNPASEWTGKKVL